MRNGADEKTIITGGVGATGGPINLAVRHGDMIYMDNIRRIMEAAGSNMDCLLKVVVWLRDQTQSEIFDRIYREYFSGPQSRRAPG